MDAPTLIHAPALAPASIAAPDPAPSAQAPHAVCDECSAAVALEQRYCVNCGTHRRNVNDPAAATSASRAFTPAAPRHR